MHRNDIVYGSYAKIHVEGGAMKTLFMTDLDGTLLNQEGKLSEGSATLLKQCINAGMAITINTSRTPVTAFSIMKDVPWNQPMALMNGVLIYHPVTKQYLNVASLSRETFMVILGIIKLYQLQTFVFGLEPEGIVTYYDSVESHSLNKFRNECIMKYDSVFTEVGDLSLISNRKILYVMLRETREKLEQLHNDLQAVKGINTSFYQDIYHPQWYYLEIFSEKASKGQAAAYIKEQGGFERLVGFGDNDNDRAFLEQCDYTYAVGNAVQWIQDTSTGIIPSNQDDGVARFLYKMMQDMEK